MDLNDRIRAVVKTLFTIQRELKTPVEPAIAQSRTTAHSQLYAKGDIADLFVNMDQREELNKALSVFSMGVKQPKPHLSIYLGNDSYDFLNVAYSNDGKLLDCRVLCNVFSPGANQAYVYMLVSA